MDIIPISKQQIICVKQTKSSQKVVDMIQWENKDLKLGFA